MPGLASIAPVAQFPQPLLSVRLLVETSRSSHHHRHWREKPITTAAANYHRYHHTIGHSLLNCILNLKPVPTPSPSQSITRAPEYIGPHPHFSHLLKALGWSTPRRSISQYAAFIHVYIGTGTNFYNPRCSCRCPSIKHCATDRRHDQCYELRYFQSGLFLSCCGNSQRLPHIQLRSFPKCVRE